MRTAPALLSALAVAAVVVSSLSGCAASNSTSSSADCTPAYASGASSSTVKVSGAKTVAAKATFPTPLVVKTPQVTQNRAGTGSRVQEGDQVDYRYTVFDGRTGELLGSKGFDASAAVPRVGVAATMNGKPALSLPRAVRCARAGERLTLVTTAKEGFGAGTLKGEGIADSAALVLIIDVVDHFPGKATGANQLPQDGLPNVITAVGGQPGIVLQEQAVPKVLRYGTVKAGSGAVVKKTDTVHIKYSGWIWPTLAGDKPLVWNEGAQDATTSGNATWTQDHAIDVTVTSTATGGGLPPGMYQAMVGARVGSQILLVMPPKYGFASGAAPTGVSSKDTVIMVIDVLGIK